MALKSANAENAGLFRFVLTLSAHFGRYWQLTMSAVKGSKQYQMVVVPHRPLYKAMIFIVFLMTLAAFSMLTYQYGMSQGLALKIEVVKERDEIRSQLVDSGKLIEMMRQDIADLKVGGEIDEKATEEVRQTIESLQDSIAELDEEIRFYKGVMLPNVASKGLRIERLDMSANPSGRIKYSLLLTQVVDKHDYVEGGVQITLRGQDGDQETSFLISDLDEDIEGAIRFRFRYFQNINGELILPDGFQPRDVMIVAQSSGSSSQRLEKRFDWSLSGG
jgi:hypothetical protein